MLESLENLENKISDCLAEINNLHSTMPYKTLLINNLLNEPFSIGKNSFFNITNLSVKTEQMLLNLKEPSLIQGGHYKFKQYEDVAKQLIDDIQNNKRQITSLRKKEVKVLLAYPELPTKYTEIFTKILEEITKNNVNTGIISRCLMNYFYNYTFCINHREISTYLYSIWYRYKSSTLKEHSTLYKLNNYNIFSEEFHLQIASSVLQNKIQNKNSVLSELIQDSIPYISQEADLYKNVLISIGDICYKNLDNEIYRNILVTDVLQSNAISKDVIDNIVSNIIMLFGNQNSDPAIKHDIKNAIIQNPNYGDPRLNPLQWANINNDAKQIFITWLAKDDLEFFFDVIFKDKNDTQRRKEFWINYVNSKELISSKVILSQLDYEKWLSLPQEWTTGRSIGIFQTRANDASCFILEFKNAIVVEFSLESNALYFYDKNILNLNLSEKLFNPNQLKYSNAYRLSRASFFEYDYNGRYTGKQKTIPNLKMKKAIAVYHYCSRLPHVQSKHSFLWAILTELYLNYLGIYPGE